MKSGLVKSLLLGCVLGSIQGCGGGGGIMETIEPCESFDVMIPNESGSVEAFAWTGHEYLIVTGAGAQGAPGDTQISRVSSNGTEGGVFATIPAAEGIVAHQWLAWSGSSLGVLVFDAGNGLSVVRFDPDGTLLGTSSVVASGVYAGAMPRIIWAGDRFAVTWLVSPVGDRELWLGEVAPDGTASTPRMLVKEDNVHPFNWIDSIASTDAVYAITISDNTHNASIVMAQRAGTEATIATLATDIPAVAVGRDELIAALSSGGSPIWFQPIDPTGVPQTPVAVPLQATSATVVTSEAGYRMYGLNFGPRELAMVDLDPTGTAVASGHTFATIPSGMATTAGPAALSAPGRFAVLASWGSVVTHFDTHRLIQQCEP